MTTHTFHAYAGVAERVYVNAKCTAHAVKVHADDAARADDAMPIWMQQRRR